MNDTNVKEIKKKRRKINKKRGRVKRERKEKKKIGKMCLQKRDVMVRHVQDNKVTGK